MPLGRGDSRNFSSGYGQQPPSDYGNKVGTEDLRRLGNKGAGRQVSQPGGPATFGPGGLLGSRSSSGRKTLGPNLSRGGDESGASSRTGTPPAQREKEKKDEKDASHINTFR
jgi:translation initiation factor 4G